MTESVQFSIDTILMSFIRKQAQLVRKDGAEVDGLLDAQSDDAYAQLTKGEVAKTESALRKLLKSHAGNRRLAAVISIAIKAAMGEV